MLTRGNPDTDPHPKKPGVIPKSCLRLPCDPCLCNYSRLLSNLLLAELEWKNLQLTNTCPYLSHTTGRPRPSKGQAGGSQWILVCPSWRHTGMQPRGTLLSTDCGFKSGSGSYLTGHRGFPQHFAEIHQGIKCLFACCRNCNNLWKKKMTTSASGNVDVVSEISFGSFFPSIVFYLHKLHHGDGVEEVKATKPVQSAGGTGDVGDGQWGRVAGKYRVSTNTLRMRAFR